MVKQSLYRPWQSLRVPGGWCSQISIQWAHEGGKAASGTHRPPLPHKEIFLVPFSVRAAGRITSMKNSIDTIGNQARDLPVCNAVPQPTAPPRTPTPSNAEVKERVELYLHSPYGPSWPVLRWNLLSFYSPSTSRKPYLMTLCFPVSRG
jgi:hypothetical protein